MALITVVVNIIVIGVIGSYPKSNSRQLIFKLCLAAADLMCGLIVLPSFIVTMYIHFISQRNISFPEENFGFDYHHANVTANETTTAATTVGYIVNTTGARNLSFLPNTGELEIKEKFPVWYLPFVGTITALTMMVTLYSLLFASCDELRSLYSPMSLSVSAALKLTRFLSVLSWAVAFCFAILPVFIHTLRPYEVITGLVLGRGPYAVLFYCFTFLLPLVITWIINIISWCKVIKDEKYEDTRNDDENVQRKLITTLTTMTALFTICVLPVGISVVIHVATHHSATNILESRESHLQLYAFELVATLIIFSKGLWYFVLYNVRSEAFRDLTVERIKIIFFSCCCYECGRKAQINARKLRRRVRSIF